MSGYEHLSKAERRRLRKLEKSDRQHRKHIDLIEQTKALTDNMQQQAKDGRPLEAKNEAQGHYILTIKSKQVTFGLGPAGTGKTYIAAAMAAEALTSKEIERIVLTRPAVEAEESLGFLPGDMNEKYDPYIAPVKRALEERLGRSTVEYMIKRGTIELMPLAFMRGHTFNDTWVLLDEAQNSTPGQMKMFLTRIGQNCKVIVNGDMSQKDFEEKSGLEDARQRFRNSKYVGICEFTMGDCVRSGFVREALLAYA